MLELKPLVQSFTHINVPENIVRIYPGGQGIGLKLKT
jgi:hypothetical protein